MSQPQLTLESFKDGAIPQLFQIAHEKIVANITDPNTDWKAKRKVVIEIVYQATDEMRENVQASAQVKTTMAPIKPLTTILDIGTAVDKEGNVRGVAHERGAILDEVSE